MEHQKAAEKTLVLVDKSRVAELRRNLLEAIDSASTEATLSAAWLLVGVQTAILSELLSMMSARE